MKRNNLWNTNIRNYSKNKRIYKNNSKPSKYYKNQLENAQLQKIYQPKHLNYNHSKNNKLTNRLNNKTKHNQCNKHNYMKKIFKKRQKMRTKILIMRVVAMMTKKEFIYLLFMRIVSMLIIQEMKMLKIKNKFKINKKILNKYQLLKQRKLKNLLCKKKKISKLNIKKSKILIIVFNNNFLNNWENRYKKANKLMKKNRRRTKP